ncbi:MAG: S-methyl-5-thioribose-1-phosphate isomerase [Desulfurococcaceae archaeon]
MVYGLKHQLHIKAVWLSDEKVCWINTLKLPFEEEIVCSDDVDRVVDAIVKMEIRGAPALGVAAALTVYAYANRVSKDVRDRVSFLNIVDESIDKLWNTRPTARNLFWSLNRMRRVLRNSIENGFSIEETVSKLREEALNILNEDIEANVKIGEFGAELIPDGATILTHCNAGALATAGYGTALGVIRAAWYSGKRIRVIATETRPVLQGARLTVWELMKEGIPVTLVTDNTVGLLFRKGLIDLVIVGADRITREGYVVNKIGTFMIATIANRFNKPFYVAAPTSTIDLNSTINDIVIEERSGDEVRKIGDKLITLSNVKVLNYAFDITDPDLVTAIVTEKGVVYKPFSENLERIVNK